MPRAKNDVRYDASAEVIKRFFAESWAAREEQKTASKLIAAMNSEMEAAGVHAGVLSWMRTIRAMPDGKRGFHLFLLQRYAAILEEELHDPAFAKQVQGAEAPRPAVPFAEQRPAA
jgi:hypothetical protein